MNGVASKGPVFTWLLVAVVTLLAIATTQGGQQGRGAAVGRGAATPAQSLSDPAPNDPALVGAIDLHAHQDPDSNGPSYTTQAARSIDGRPLEFAAANPQPDRDRLACQSRDPFGYKKLSHRPGGGTCWSHHRAVNNIAQVKEKRTWLFEIESWSWD